MPVIEYNNKSKIILNARNSSLDGTLTTDLPAVTLQHGLFRYVANVMYQLAKCYLCKSDV